ncbi:MAG TPA: BrnT family toxin [Gemmatimonadaceae bacterium]|nr:BrnT family toxin [Gemmatimonadaceae bacterium]
MRFDWNPTKNRSNIRHHGVDFADASLMFERPTWERWDDREDYGEERWIAIGPVQGIELTVVYTDRRTKQGAVRWIISARRATQDERKAYYRGIGG